MKKIVILIVTVLISVTTAEAQTYLENLQKKSKGMGTVTVSQSKEIDKLVNGKRGETAPTTSKQIVKKEVVPPSSDKHVATTATTHHDVDSTKKINPPKIDSTEKKTEEKPAEGVEIPTVDVRKKVMTGTQRVTGYRVQAFAGGNSRNDKIKAQQIGDNIKMSYPDYPIYVHFYSPRWICRVGNFRSYEEASSMLRNIKNLGYKEACIVKGKITVQY